MFGAPESAAGVSSGAAGAFAAGGGAGHVFSIEQVQPVEVRNAKGVVKAINSALDRAVPDLVLQIVNFAQSLGE